MPMRMDNVGIVVADLSSAVTFFEALGLELEGRSMIEGSWAAKVTGLGHQSVEIAMLRTPDGHGRLELSQFLLPPIAALENANGPSPGKAMTGTALSSG